MIVIMKKEIENEELRIEKMRIPFFQFFILNSQFLILNLQHGYHASHIFWDGRV